VPAPVAVLDGCVLFQGRLTNLLLHLAEAKAFEPIWSDDIHAEWMRNLHFSMSIPTDKIEYWRGEMERAFPAANVPAPPTLVATIQGVSKTAAQRKDAHVVATAVIAKEAVIVTHNIRDLSPQCSGVMAWPKLGLTRSAWGCSPVMRRRSSLEYVPQHTTSPRASAHVPWSRSRPRDRHQA
jgi:hypothetical protein